MRTNHTESWQIIQIQYENICMLLRILASQTSGVLSFLASADISGSLILWNISAMISAGAEGATTYVSH